VILPNDLAYEPATMPEGLTKRELFAAMAMQGSLGGVPGNHLVPPNLARQSVDYADALLAALAKEPQP
jgi:hypothetical protein